MKKIFVVDTNVILHDHRCIYSFEDNDIHIPIIVLEELDKFKKGNDLVNFQAREFIRELNILGNGDRKFKEGVDLGEGYGKLYIEVGFSNNEEVYNAFPEKTADHRILSITKEIIKKEETSKDPKNVVLITKDINLRVKAMSIGIKAEDYETGKVKDINTLTNKAKIVEVEKDDNIEKIFTDGESLSCDSFGIEKPECNTYFIIRSSKKSVLVSYDMETEKLKRIEKKKIYGIEPRNAEQTFAIDALINPNISLVSILGVSGCLIPSEKITIYKMRTD